MTVLKDLIEILKQIPEFNYKTSIEEFQRRIKGREHDVIIMEVDKKPAGFLIAYALDEAIY